MILNCCSCILIGAFNNSIDITMPNPGTSSLPLGTSIFGVSLTSVLSPATFVVGLTVGLATVGDDGELSCFTSAFVSTVVSTFTSCTGISTDAVVTSTDWTLSIGVANVFIGLTGLAGFVTFVIDFSHVFCVSTHAPKIG